MRKKLKVGVIMGGPSAEYEVSLASGEQVLKNLDKKKYLAMSVKVSKTGQWFWDGKRAPYLDIFKKIDLAFLAVHGEFGEDGRLQGLLDFHGVPYTGSGMAASALAMDKLKSRELFNLAGLTTPRTWVSLANVAIRHVGLPSESRHSLSPVDLFAVQNYTARNQAIHRLERSQWQHSPDSPKISFPVMVKPRSRGSSVGVMLANNKPELEKAIRYARRFDKEVLVEEYLTGTEITCGVLENFNGQKHFALPLTEIIPVKRKFFDYTAKYTPGASREITPARISEKETKAVREAAIRAHQLLDCAGYSRSDFILTPGKAYLLEVNTLPGLTGTSLLPQGAAAAGLTFSKLLDKIIKSSFFQMGG